MTKERIYMLITLIAAYLQASVVPSLGLTDSQSFIATSLLLIVASVFTILKQRLSVEVNDRKALLFTWVLIGIAVIGGLNEIVASQRFTEAFHFSDKFTNAMRAGIAGLFGILNVFSKAWFPTEAGKVIQNIKSDLKQGTFGTENTVDVSQNK